MPIIELLDLFIESYSSIPLFYTGTSVFSIFYILPIILLIRNYYYTGSVDYLLIAAFAIFLMFNLIFFIPWFYALSSFMSGDLQAKSAFWIAHLVFYFTWSFVLFVNYMWAIRVKWSKPHPVLLFVGFAYIIVALLIDTYWLFDLTTYYQSGLDSFLRIFREACLGLSAAVFFFAFLTTERVSDYKTVKTVRKLWIFGGAICMLRAVMNIILVLLPGGFDPFLVELISMSNNYILIGLYFILYTRYPECLLITEVQVLRACKLYTTVKTDPDSLPSSLGMDQIKKYIATIHEAIWEKGCE